MCPVCGRWVAFRHLPPDYSGCGRCSQCCRCEGQAATTFWLAVNNQIVVTRPSTQQQVQQTVIQPPRLTKVVAARKVPKNYFWCNVCRNDHPKNTGQCRHCGKCRRVCGGRCRKGTAHGMIIESKPGVVNTLARPLGIEVEIAYLNRIDRIGIVGKWDHDATITRGGLEWVSKPMGGDKWVQYLHTFLTAVAKVQPQVDQTCGLHVHVQAGDLGWYQVRRLVAIWCRIEESLFGTLVQEERKNNHYCIPFASETPSCPWQFSKKDVRRLMRSRSKGFMRDGSSWIKNQLISKLYNIKLDCFDKVSKEQYEKILYKFNSIKANKRTPGQAEGRGCRYGALNLHALFYQQTVEFRLKEGTLEPSELLFWPLTCAWIVESSQRMSDKEAMGLRGVADWADVARKHGMQQGVYDWVVGKITEGGK